MSGLCLLSQTIFQLNKFFGDVKVLNERVYSIGNKYTLIYFYFKKIQSPEYQAAMSNPSVLAAMSNPRVMEALQQIQQGYATIQREAPDFFRRFISYQFLLSVSCHYYD